uniref:CD99 antigen-like protein 2 n=2 Tax=Sinocyclocheilus TaxID=75365 RepID=A0A671MB12_9TELE
AGGAGGAVKPSLKPVKPTVKEPAKPKPKQTDFGDLDLEDALNPDNDIRGKGKDSGKGGRLMVFSKFSGSQFSDDDLVDVGSDNSYKPDKGKGDKLKLPDRSSHYTMAETGTIAGIVSAVAMALVGAVSSYISYQKKKLCFSIQQSLNADMVKADAPDAVVAQEPQVQQTLLQPPNAEPPTEENAV